MPRPVWSWPPWEGDGRAPAEEPGRSLVGVGGALLRARHAAASTRGDAVGAIARYELALSEWPDNPAANNNLAWLLATSRDEAHRDPKRAVALAERACELTERRDPAVLGTLAAAYAGDGRTSDAARTAREALDLARETGARPSIEALEAQLRGYEQGRAAGR